MAGSAENVVGFYSKRGTCEQWIKDGKGAIKWTRLSCRSVADNAVRLQLHALAYNLGNFGHARYVAFQMVEVSIPRNLLADILRMIGELRSPPVTSRG